MSTSTRWGGFRPDPYNPNAVDADSDGIVQEGTLFERPAGTRFVNLDGSELRMMIRGDNLSVLDSIRLVDADGNPVEYDQSWRAGKLSIGQQVGTLESRGFQTIGQMVGIQPVRAAPRVASPKIEPQDVVIPEKYGGSRGLSELQQEFPELFDRDGNLRQPFRPRFQPHGLKGDANELMRGASTWAEVRERLKGKTIIAYDYETTGFVDQGGRPVQIGAVKIVDGEVVDRFNVYINPGVPFEEWSAFSRDNLKWQDGSLITPDRLSTFGSSEQAHKEFLDWIGNEEFYLMGHNAFSFDDVLLERESKLVGVDEPNAAGRIDTWSLAADINQALGDRAVTRSNALTALTDALGIDLGERAHTADADSEATGKLLFALLDAAEKGDVSTSIVDPDEVARVELERRQKYDADMERYNRANAVYREIMDASKAAKLAKRQTSRDKDRKDSDRVVKAPEVEEDDVVDLSQLQQSVDSITEGVQRIVDGVYYITTQNMDADLRDIEAEKLIKKPRKRRRYVKYNYSMLLDEEGKVPELDEDSAETLSEVKRVGRTMRKEVERRLSENPLYAETIKKIEQIAKEAAILEEELKPSVKVAEDYLDNIAMARYGKVSDKLKPKQLKELFEYLDTLPPAQQREYDALLNAAYYNETTDVLSSYNEMLRILRLRQRSMTAAYYTALLSGEETDSKGMRFVESTDDLPELNSIIKLVGVSQNPGQYEVSEDRVRQALANVEKRLPRNIRALLTELIQDQGLKLEFWSKTKLKGFGGHFDPVDRSIVVSRDAAKLEDDTLEQVILHEILHCIQNDSPEMFTLEQIFGQSRNVGRSMKDVEFDIDGTVVMQDDFSSSYCGKIYNNDMGRGNYLELVTNALDKLLFPTSSTLTSYPDDDHIDFILGVILGFRKVDKNSRDYFLERSTVFLRSPGADAPKSPSANIPYDNSPDDSFDMEEVLSRVDLVPDIISPFDEVESDPDVIKRRETFLTGNLTRFSSLVNSSGSEIPLRDIIESLYTPVTGLPHPMFDSIPTSLGVRDHTKAMPVSKDGQQLMSRLRSLGRSFNQRSYEAITNSLLADVDVNEVNEKADAYYAAKEDLKKVLLMSRQGDRNEVMAELRKLQGLLEYREVAKWFGLDGIYSAKAKKTKVLESVYSIFDNSGLAQLVAPSEEGLRFVRPLPYNTSPEDLRMLLEERKNLTLQAMIAALSVNKKGIKPGDTPPDEVVALLSSALDLAVERAYKKDMLFVYQDGDEYEQFMRTRGAAVLSDGRSAYQLRASLRRKAAIEFMKSVDPSFGTGVLDLKRLNYSKFAADAGLSEAQVRKLFKDFQESVPAWWVEYLNEAGYEIIFSRRGFHRYRQGEKVIALSAGGDLAEDLGIIHNDPSQVYLGVLVHEVGHAVSEPTLIKYEPELLKRFPLIQANVTACMTFLHTYAKSKDAIDITPKKDASGKEVSFGSSLYSGSLNYLLKTYPDSDKNNAGYAATEVLSMGAEAIYLGIQDRVSAIQRRGSDAEDALLGIFLMNLINPGTPTYVGTLTEAADRRISSGRLRAKIPNSGKTEESAAVVAKNNEIFDRLNENDFFWRFTTDEQRADFYRREAAGVKRDNAPRFMEPGDLEDSIDTAFNAVLNSSDLSRSQLDYISRRIEEEENKPVPNEQTIDNLNAYVKLAKRRLDYLESTPQEEVISAVVNFLMRASDSSQSTVAVQVSSEAFLDLINQNGKYRTIHTDPSVNLKDKELRRAYEVSLGIPLSADDDLRPASGVVLHGKRKNTLRSRAKQTSDSKKPFDGDDPLGSAGDLYNSELDINVHYDLVGESADRGGITIELRPEVNERTKWALGSTESTLADPAPLLEPSYNEIRSMIFSDLGGRGADNESAANNFEQILNLMLSPDGNSGLGGRNPRTYNMMSFTGSSSNEALIYGSFDFTDVGTVYVDEAKVVGEARSDLVSVIEYDEFLLQLINPTDLALLKRYYVAGNGESRIERVAKRIDQIRRRREFAEKIKGINDSINVKWLREDGEDLDVLLKQLGEERGVAPDAVLYTIFQEELQDLLATL